MMSKFKFCGVPHFDHHIQVKQAPAYKELLQNLSLDPEQPYLFVAMSSPRFAPHEIDIVEWLAKAINDNIFGRESSAYCKTASAKCPRCSIG